MTSKLHSVTAGVMVTRFVKYVCNLLSKNITNTFGDTIFVPAHYDFQKLHETDETTLTYYLK